MRCHLQRLPRQAFTLIELLVVITIIGILISLLLPAVQSAREGARRTQCTNNLSQIAKAWMLHEGKHKFFPSGGWGWNWSGYPEQGFGKNQPAGWSYSILPYMEQQNLYNLPSSQNGTRDATPVATLYCPSRRAAQVYGGRAKSDYAANAGDGGKSQVDGGPGSIDAGMDPVRTWDNPNQYTGVSFLRSEITFGHIRDGSSNTYMAGEKYLNPDSYESGSDGADNEHAYVGFDNDLFRTCSRGSAAPQQDTAGSAMTDTYGSAHSAGLNMAFCDGRVQVVSYGIDRETHARLSSRADQLPVDDKNY